MKSMDSSGNMSEMDITKSPLRDEFNRRTHKGILFYTFFTSKSILKHLLLSGSNIMQIMYSSPLAVVFIVSAAYAPYAAGALYQSR